jgi:hypothetical protein
MKDRLTGRAMVLSLALCAAMIAWAAEQKERSDIGQDKGEHSSYTIGNAIRSVKQKTVVIPVHYYWRVGMADTGTSMTMKIKIGEKLYEIRSQDSFATDSHTGTENMTTEFFFRDWRPDLSVNDLVPALVDVKTLSVLFTATVNGRTQTLEKEIGIDDMEPMTKEAKARF